MLRSLLVSRLLTIDTLLSRRAELPQQLLLLASQTEAVHSLQSAMTQGSPVAAAFNQMCIFSAPRWYSSSVIGSRRRRGRGRRRRLGTCIDA